MGTVKSMSFVWEEALEETGKQSHVASVNLPMVFSVLQSSHVSPDILTGSSQRVQVVVHEQETDYPETAVYSSLANEICEKVTSYQRLKKKSF